MKISLEELAAAAEGRILFGSPALAFENITTASGSIRGNDLFVPVIGEKTDGHLYIGSAFDNGAVCSLTMQENAAQRLNGYRDSKGLVLVEDSVTALQKLAVWFRKTYLHMPFIGVTGSVGKTTTREMICAALRSGKRVYSTKGNANSQIGVPFTVLGADPEAEYGVVELGVSEFGEMRKIAEIADVGIAVITNIGISHLAQFRTQENILREKLRILSGPSKEAILLVNGDDPFLCGLTAERIHELGIDPEKEIRFLRYGTGEKCDYRAENSVKTEGYPEFTFCSPKTECRLRLSVPGDHMVMNAAAAMAVCELCGLDPDRAAESLGSFTGYEGRGNRILRDGYTIINDCYNASPVSMRNGLNVLSELKAEGKKIAVLADMKELGDEEIRYHRELGQYINESVKDLAVLYTYGELAALIGEEVRKNGRIRVREYRDQDLLKKDLYAEIGKGDILFLKGSQSMGLKKLI